MCNTLELLKARRRIAELESQQLPPIPEITRFTIPQNLVTDELSMHGISTLYRRLDSDYVYTDAVGWVEVISYIYIHAVMPTYFVKPDGTWNMDCEDFAIWFKSMVSLYFGLNYCGISFGLMAQGEHSFNVLRDEKGIKLYEPQPGFDINHLFHQGENGYNAREVLL